VKEREILNELIIIIDKNSSDTKLACAVERKVLNLIVRGDSLYRSNMIDFYALDLINGER
jgi:hypothetical protein